MKRIALARYQRRHLTFLQRCLLRRQALYCRPFFPRSGKVPPVQALADRPEDVTHSQSPSAPIPTPRRRPVMTPIDLRTVPSAMEQRAAGWRKDSE